MKNDDLLVRSQLNIEFSGINPKTLAEFQRRDRILIIPCLWSIRSVMTYTPMPDDLYLRA